MKSMGYLDYDFSQLLSKLRTRIPLWGSSKRAFGGKFW
jgi:hypothetical protein